LKPVSSINLPALTIDLLVDNRSAPPHRAAVELRDQITLGIQFKLVRALEFQRDDVWVRSGRDQKVVLQLTLIAVIDEINTAIHRFVFHPGKERYRGKPIGGIASNEVI